MRLFWLLTRRRLAVACKSGYIYVYASNQSPVSVLFYNLQVIETDGGEQQGSPMNV
jgi:hypothetical protein